MMTSASFVLLLASLSFPSLNFPFALFPFPANLSTSTIPPPPVLLRSARSLACASSRIVEEEEREERGWRELDRIRAMAAVVREDASGISGGGREEVAGAIGGEEVVQLSERVQFSSVTQREVFGEGIERKAPEGERTFRGSGNVRPWDGIGVDKNKT